MASKSGSRCSKACFSWLLRAISAADWKAEAGGFRSDFGIETRATDCQFLLPLNLQRVILALHVVAVNLGTLAKRLEKRSDGIVPGNLIGGHRRGLDPLFVNGFAVAIVGEIALGRGQALHES